MDGHAARFVDADLFGVGVDPHHVVAHFRQARAGDEAEIAGADEGDFHGLRRAGGEGAGLSPLDAGSWPLGAAPDDGCGKLLTVERNCPGVQSEYQP